MFRGSCVALVTPMTQAGAVDKPAFTALVEWHLAQGTDALVIGGTTGESATLMSSELRDLLEIAIGLSKKATNPIPIIAGTGSNSTEQTIAQTTLAQALGCDGALIVTPYYNKPTQEGLYLHYQKIADNVDLPIILYNVPSRTGCDLLPQTAARLSAIANIVGIKDATGDLDRMAIYAQAIKPGFRLYSGDDASAMAFMGLGGDGVISVSGNIVPKVMHQLCCAVFDGDQKKANDLNNTLQALYKQLFVESNPIPVKWALSEMGLIANKLRLPLSELSEQHHAAFRAILQNLGVLDNAQNNRGNNQSA